MSITLEQLLPILLCPPPEKQPLPQQANVNNFLPSFTAIRFSATDEESKLELTSVVENVLSSLDTCDKEQLSTTDSAQICADPLLVNQILRLGIDTSLDILFSSRFPHAGPLNERVAYIRGQLATRPVIENLTCSGVTGRKMCCLPPDLECVQGLQTLSLPSHAIRHLPIMPSLQGLSVLCLSDNELIDVPEDITLLTNLTSFSCDNNRLQSLPESLFTLNKLEQLNCSNNSIKILSPSVTNLSSLVKLDVSKNFLPALPAKIHLLQNLQVLNASKNEITFLPQTIWKIPSLLELNLSHNSIKSLSARIKNLVRLTELNVTNNCLRTIPVTIGNMSTLQVLKVGQNSLGKLPELHLPSLHTLKADDNRLHTLPSLSQCTALATLSISKNRFRRLPNFPESLQMLDASENQLSHVPSGIPKTIQRLNISVNKISAVPSDSLSSLKELTHFDVSVNHITTIPPQIGKLIKLSALFLSNNGLRSLPQSMNNLKALTVLDVSDNALTSLSFDPETLPLLTNLDVDNNKFLNEFHSVLLEKMDAAKKALRQANLCSQDEIQEMSPDVLYSVLNCALFQTVDQQFVFQDEQLHLKGKGQQLYTISHIPVFRLCRDSLTALKQRIDTMTERTKQETYETLLRWDLSSHRREPLNRQPIDLTLALRTKTFEHQGFLPPSHKLQELFAS